MKVFYALGFSAASAIGWLLFQMSIVAFCFFLLYHVLTS